jgi:hypothetical protein
LSDSAVRQRASRQKKAKEKAAAKTKVLGLARQRMLVPQKQTQQEELGRQIGDSHAARFSVRQCQEFSSSSSVMFIRSSSYQAHLHGALCLWFQFTTQKYVSVSSTKKTGWN